MRILVRSSDAVAFAACLDAARHRVERFPIVIEALRALAEALRGGPLAFLRVGEISCGEVVRTRMRQSLGAGIVGVAQTSVEGAGEPAMIVACDAAAMTSIVWCACGGTGTLPARRVGPPGAIELGILRLVGQAVSDAIAATLGRDVPEFRPAPVVVGALEASSPLLASEAQVFSCRLVLNLPGTAADLMVILQAVPLAPFRDAVPAARRGGHGAQATPAEAPAAAIRFDRATVDVQVVLDELVMPLGQLAALAGGETLALGATASDGVSVESGGMRLASGRVCKRGGRLVVEIERVGGTGHAAGT